MAVGRSDMFDQLTGSVSPRERMILIEYYEHGLTLREIGEMLGLTESRVSQIHSSAMDSLRLQLESRAEDAAHGADRGTPRPHREAGPRRVRRRTRASDEREAGRGRTARLAPRRAPRRHRQRTTRARASAEAVEHGSQRSAPRSGGAFHPARDAYASASGARGTRGDPPASGQGVMRLSSTAGDPPGRRPCRPAAGRPSVTLERAPEGGKIGPVGDPNGTSSS